MVILLIMVSCNETERLTYEGDTAICFNVSKTKIDTIAFAILTKEDGSKYDIPVMLIGNLLSSERIYKVEVVANETTATEGVNYKLENECIFPADTARSNFPVILYKSDPELSEKIKYLTLRLVPTSELGVAFENRSKVVISLTTMLRVPAGTGYYGDMTFFENMFGPYSKKKHEIIIEIVGHDFWDGNYGVAGGLNGLLDEEQYYLPYSRSVLKYFMEHEVYDENGNLIKPW